MTLAGEFDRRSFLIGATATAGGVALGFAIPFVAPDRARGAAGACEITCWVVIAADDTVIIRVARDEMGQGAMTGLAMLVAEELECDWARVRTEIVSQEENLRRALRRYRDRRQPLGRFLAELSAPRRRHRPRDADRGGGRALAGAGDGVQGAQ
jgi:CO/xanthine dehydrogenase Mo-binding subunit